MSVVEGAEGSLAAVPALPRIGPVPVADGRLDQDSPEPLWQQLAALLRERIRSGEVAGRLQAEMAMALHHQVSRDTVRRALAQLHQEGLIQATRGRGTFVIPSSERGD